MGYRALGGVMPGCSPRPRPRDRLGRSEEALTLLRRLRDANLADLTNIDADPAFESLRQDSRFLALQPTAEELAQPFVEDIEVLHQWIGEAAGDNFGWIARNLGGRGRRRAG